MFLFCDSFCGFLWCCLVVVLLLLFGCVGMCMVEGVDGGVGIKVDGCIDLVEWVGVWYIIDFCKVQLFNGDLVSLLIEVWVLFMFKGLVIVFCCIQLLGVLCM